MERDMQPQKVNGRTLGRTPAEPGKAPAGARLLAYLGHGAELAVIPGGMVLAVQADHLPETVRLGDLWGGDRREA
jgi:hypothetical protein